MKDLNKIVNLLTQLALAETDDIRRRIVRQIKDMDKQTEAPHDSVMHAVQDLVTALGVPCSLTGYNYLVTAVYMMLDDEALREAITKRLYPEIAVQYNSTPARVERAMRFAIETAWDRGDTDVLNKYFGNIVSYDKGRPTVREFVCQLAHVVKRQEGIE